MIRSSRAQRLFGVFVVALGLFITRMTWQQATTTGRFTNLGVVGPAFAMIGVASLLFPLDVEEFRARYGVDRIQRWSQLPTPWKVLVALGLVLSVGFFLLLSGAS